MINRTEIETAVTAAMEYFTRDSWFLPGTRETAIERAAMQRSREAVIDVISEALDEGRIIWRGDDPHDYMGWQRHG